MRFTLNGKQLELTAEDVRRALRDVNSEPLHQYTVTIGSALYPVKQVFEVVTGVPRSGFTTQVARRVLAAMGFDAVAGGGQMRAEERPHADVSDVAAPCTAMLLAGPVSHHNPSAIDCSSVFSFVSRSCN